MSFEIIENGSETEIFTQMLVKTEAVSAGTVRLCWGIKRGKYIYVTHYQIVPTEALPAIARLMLATPGAMLAPEPFSETRLQ